MIDLAEKTVKLALKFGAEYAETRIGRAVKTTIRAVNDKLEQITSGTDRGLGIRALHKGAFGFASSNSFNRHDLEESTRMAVKAAKVSSTEIKEKVFLAPVETLEDRIVMRSGEAPSKVDVTRKMKLIIRAYKAAKEVSPKVASVDTLYGDGTEEGAIVTSEGTKIFRGSSYLMLRVLVFAREEEKISMCYENIGSTGGFELFEEQPVEKCAEKAAERAVAMLKAKPAPSGRFTIIADPLLTGTFAHEAVGHACEGDAVIAGESILKDKLGQMIGSQDVSIYDDSSLPQSWGSSKYDDEGVITKKRLLIDHGILRAFILNREAAAKLELEPNGGARAQSYAFRPLVRMSSTYISSGDYEFEELVEDTKHGLYLRGTRGGQVNPAVGSFQFNAEDAFMIENGEVTAPISDVSLSGLTLEILKNIDAVGKDLTLHVGHCGKEDQIVRVMDGGPHIKIRNVVVGGRV